MLFTPNIAKKIPTFSLNLLLIVLLSWSNQTAIANPTNQPETNQENTNTREKREDSRSILAAIWDMLRAKREQEPALSSRSNICEITPGLIGNTNLIYSDRPLFLWQGTATKIVINLYSPFSLDSEQKLLWSQTINDQSQSFAYRGEPLQPGEIYDWEITLDSMDNRRRISFQVMPQSERDRISEQLQILQTRLAISGASVEEISLAKAKYFAQQDLWSDALHKLHSIENPSSTTREDIEKITSYICQLE